MPQIYDLNATTKDPREHPFNPTKLAQHLAVVCHQHPDSALRRAIMAVYIHRGADRLAAAIQELSKDSKQGHGAGWKLLGQCVKEGQPKAAVDAVRAAFTTECRTVGSPERDLPEAVKGLAENEQWVFHLFYIIVYGWLRLLEFNPFLDHP